MSVGLSDAITPLNLTTAKKDVPKTNNAIFRPTFFQTRIATADRTAYSYYLMHFLCLCATPAAPAKHSARKLSYHGSVGGRHDRRLLPAATSVPVA